MRKLARRCRCRLLRKEEAARKFNISPKTFDRHVKSGLLPQPVKIGRFNLWRSTDLAEAADRLAVKGIENAG